MYSRIIRFVTLAEKQGKPVDRPVKTGADYGNYLTKFITDQLKPEYGNGFSKRQIELFRQFYRTFPIANTVYSQLSWSQYKVIIRLHTALSCDLLSFFEQLIFGIIWLRFGHPLVATFV
ncbi:DUF1016 N-terminal domain-containing protein [Mucilaginibacter angelicae]|uniref:DUF1016 N-terminal domain-containing protein n=1 Tax=Mucilaginibacter angelicae TaxID=869718 RepID=A0ABV6LF59_9SPHI